LDENGEIKNFIIGKFKDWLKKANSDFSKVDIQFQNKEIVIFAKEGLSPNQEIMFIPSSILVNLEKIKTSNVLQKINIHNLNISPAVCYFTMFLLSEKSNKDSFYKPYVDILPDDYFNIGLFFDEYETHWLRGSTLFEEVRGKKEEMKKFFNLVKDEFNCSFEDFCWAYSNANSKNFNYVNKETENTYMIPLIDLLTIDIPNNNQTKLEYDQNRDGFSLKANKKNILKKQKNIPIIK